MVARVLARVQAWEEDEAAGSWCIPVDGRRESSVFTTGLPLVLRGSYAVNTAAAAGIPSFAGPMPSKMVRTSCDERGWSRQKGVGAGSGCDGPEIEAGGPRCIPEPLVAAVVGMYRFIASAGKLAMAGNHGAAHRKGRTSRKASW